MRTFKSFALLLFITLSASLTKADSPLTSTPFYKAYFEQEKMVSYAKEKGVIDKRIAKFLMKKNKPIGVKAAVVNALGWKSDGNNAEVFLSFLAVKRDVRPDDFSRLTGSDLMCMGYMMAMDNYFDVEDAEKVLIAAKEKLPNSFTVHLIHALILGQLFMDSDWCMVWSVYSDVNSNVGLTKDIRPSALKIVHEYLSLYKDECD